MKEINLDRALADLGMEQNEVGVVKGRLLKCDSC